MSVITTHVLDTSRGKPAARIPIVLERSDGKDGWMLISCGRANADGRIPDLVPAGVALKAGAYRLTFDTEAYFRANDEKCFYPYVAIVFEIRKAGEHYHVPLLLSPFGYSTYRGS